jgi:hypothetical protein
VTIQIALFKLIISRVFQVNFSSRDSRQFGLTIGATILHYQSDLCDDEELN